MTSGGCRGVCEVLTKEKVNLPDRVSLRGVVDLREPLESSRGLKIGVELRRTQHLEAFELSVGGKPLSLVSDTASCAISSELSETFPPTDHERWLGYLVEPFGEGTYDALETSITVSNFKVASHAFQTVPVVFGYSDEAFRTGYLLAVHILSGIDALALRARIDGNS